MSKKLMNLMAMVAAGSVAGSVLASGFAKDMRIRQVKPWQGVFSVIPGCGCSKGLYCVIDLTGGTTAESYPVTYLSAVPFGGWTDEYKTTKLVLRRLEPGTFLMGSSSDEAGRYDDETKHQVTLTKGFYIGVFEVTQRQWELVMGTRPSWFNNSNCYATRPVEEVSYDMIRGASLGAQWPASNAVDADSFLGRIRAKTGLVFDLPTEAQWEYACRAGTTTMLNSGKNLASTEKDPKMGRVGRYWYNGGSSYDRSVSTDGATAKVGSYAPNAWGLYDMHGNVWEWCLDWWQSNPGTSAVTDPMGASSGSCRSPRGGSWHFDAQFCRSACRYHFYCYPSYGRNVLGFRLACSSLPKSESASGGQDSRSCCTVKDSAGDASTPAEASVVKSVYGPAVGDWHALLSDESGVHAGLFELSVTETGKASCRITTVAGTISLTPEVTLEPDEGVDGEGTISIGCLKKTGDETSGSLVRLEFDVRSAFVHYESSTWKNGETTTSVELYGAAGRRNVAMLTDSGFKTKFFDRCYTVVPGHLTLTVDKRGAVKVAGKLADGEKISASSFLLPSADGDSASVLVFTVPSNDKKQECVVLELHISPDGSASLL